MNIAIENLTLSSGLNCCIIERRGFKEARCYVCVNFGSNVTKYRDGSGTYSVRPGTAHFLEHKMFDERFMGEFARLSAECNAFTDFNGTVYHFGCPPENVLDSLALMLEMLAEVRFDGQSVEFEKGIISQEIKMYADDPSYRAYFSMLTAMYSSLGIRETILGTEGDIAAMSADELKRCHSAFYRGGNIGVLVVGDVNAAQTVDAVRRCDDALFSRKQFTAWPVYGKEQQKPAIGRSDSTMGLSVPCASVGFKGQNFKAGGACAVAVDMLFGEGADLYDELYKSGVIDESFGGAHFSGTNYSHAVFAGYSKDTDALFNAVVRHADKAALNGFDTATFERAKRRRIGQLTRMFDNFEATGVLFADAFFKGQTIKDVQDELNALTLENVNNAAEMFRAEQAVMAVVCKDLYSETISC